MNKMVLNHIRSLPEGTSWMLDGFPRTEAQAQFLLSSGVPITHVIHLTGNEAEITKRLSGRLFDPVTRNTYHVDANPPPAEIRERCVQRNDDKPEVIKERFLLYRQSKAAIKGAFADKMVSIDGSGKSIEQVADEIEKCLLK